MGSMRDEMAKVVASWEEPTNDQPSTQPTENNAMQETAGTDSLTLWCLATVKEKSHTTGITGIQLARLFENAFPDKAKRNKGQISACLKTLSDQGRLGRMPVIGKSIDGRDCETHAYFLAPEGEADRVKAERKAKRLKAKNKSKRGTNPNSLKNLEKSPLRQRKVNEAQAELPLVPRAEVPAPAKVASVKPVITLSISINGNDVALSLAEAKRVHEELSSVFTG